MFCCASYAVQGGCECTADRCDWDFRSRNGVTIEQSKARMTAQCDDGRVYLIGEIGDSISMESCSELCAIKGPGDEASRLLSNAEQ